MRILLLFTFFFFNSCALNSSFKGERKLATNDAAKKREDQARPAQWPERFWRSVLIGIDDAGYSLTQVLFDNIDEFDQNIFNADRAQMKVKVKRVVYDNQDVLNSYSVVDSFRLGLDSKDLTLSTPLFTPNLTLGFSMGIGGVMEWSNIRQVNANKYTKLPSINEEYKDLDYLNLNVKERKELAKRERRKRKNYKKKYKKMAKQIWQGEKGPSELEPDPGGEVQQMDTYGGGAFLDPSFRPRTNRLWNLVSFPFRLPTNLKRLVKMEDGELISYSVSGYVELGPYVGFAMNPFEIPGNLKAQAYYKLFLKGNFKITILKENDRFVRVKLTRKRERGSRYGIGAGAHDYELYEGFLLFEGKKLETKILQTKSSLVPFQFKVEKKYIKSFDVGFRYDLKYEQAQEAFHKSVFGSFARSLELQGRVDPDTQEKAVERLFVKDAVGRQTQTQHRLDLQFLTKDVGKKTESIEAVLTLPSGEHQVFKESKEINNEWKVVWGRYEKLNYNYTISLDKTAYLKGEKNSFQLIVEAAIEDSHTNGKEMKRYMEQVRQALGDDSLLPELPVYLPRHQRIHYQDDDEDIQDMEHMKKARYRKSSFYYGFNINQEQLEKFIHTPVEKMWPILEKAFGVSQGQWATGLKRANYRAKNILPTLANYPLFLANIHLRKGNDVEVATRIKKKWEEIQSAYIKKHEDDLFEDIDHKIKILSEIFSYKYFGHELLRILMFSLNDEQMDYFLVATNDAFGRIQQRGRVTTNPEYLLNLTDENIGFERQAGGFKSNPDILIKNLEAEVLEDGRVQFDFDLDHVPKILYLKLFRTNRLQKFALLAELAFKNTSRFKEGHNTLIVDKNSLNELEYILGSALEENNFYSLTLSSTVDGYSWSKVATRRFQYVLPIAEHQQDQSVEEENISFREKRRQKRLERKSNKDEVEIEKEKVSDENQQQD